MSSKEKGAPRTCSICKKSGHNARTCSMRTSRDESSRTMVDAAGSSPDLGESMGDIVNEGSVGGSVPRERPSLNGHSGQFDVRHEPVTFTEQTIQEHVSGVTYRLTAREYQNGVTVVNLKTMSEAQEPRDIQFDLEGASKVTTLLSTLLQGIAARKQKAALPVVRVNGLSQPNHATATPVEARQ